MKKTYIISINNNYFRKGETILTNNNKLVKIIKIYRMTLLKRLVSSIAQYLKISYIPKTDKIKIREL